MLCHQQREICIFCLLFCTFIAVSIYCNYTICIFIHHNSFGIHAESSHSILKFFCAIDNFTFIQLICKMRKNNCWKLYTHTNVYSIGLGRNCKFSTDALHPFTATSTNRNNAFVTLITIGITIYTIPIFSYFHICDRHVKIKINLIFHLGIQIFQHNIVNICTKMTNRGIK